MSEPGGWSTPDGWGAPASPPPTGPGGPAPGGQGYDAPPAYGAPGQGQGWQGPGQPGPDGGAPYGRPQAPWGMRPVDDKPGVIPLRPLGLGEVLDGAVSVLRRYPRPALGLAAIVALVSTLCNVAAARHGLRALPGGRHRRPRGRRHAGPPGRARRRLRRGVAQPAALDRLRGGHDRGDHRRRRQGGARRVGDLRPGVGAGALAPAAAGRAGAAGAARRARHVRGGDGRPGSRSSPSPAVSAPWSASR